MDQNQTASAPTPPFNKHELFTREYSLGELLSLTWKLFSDNFKTILIVTLIVYVPINIIIALIPTPVPTVTDPADLSGIWLDAISSTSFMMIVLLTSLAGVLVPLAISLITKKRLGDQTIDYQTALKQAITRWLPGIGTTVLMSIFLFGLFLLLIIPGIIFTIYWAFAVYAVMLNNKSGLAALKYSKSVVNGRWWRTFGYLLVFGLISGLLSWLVNAPLAAFINNPVINVISSLIANIIFSFVIVASVLLFLNLEATSRSPSQHSQDTSLSGG